MQLESRTAIVTGAAGKGMGRSIALTLAREGARVVVNYRTSEKSAKAIVRCIEAGGGNAVAVQADIQDAHGCRALVEAAEVAFGGVDICVVGPGGGWHMEPIDKLDAETALADLQQEIAPLYHLMPLVLPAMKRRKWGRIVVISLEPSFGSPAYAYNAAKAARTHAALLAQGQAWEQGVTVNVIAPGPVAGIETLEAAAEQCAHGSAWRGRKKVSPQDIAETVAHLCSEAGRFVSGCVVPFREA